MKSLVYGLFPTGFALLVSYALARWGFENMYYMSQLLPVFMAFYLALAWFIYLRRTSFAWSRSRKKPIDALGHHESDLARDLPDDKMSGEELRHLRNEAGLVFPRESRAGEPYGHTKRGPGDEHGSEDVRARANIEKATGILLWSALQIAVMATVLYHLFGIGATYY
ncbi:MAG: hypothetical protein ACOYEQ_09430 [Bacillota bacterium]